jgi:hypothetical protein
MTSFALADDGVLTGWGFGDTHQLANGGHDAPTPVRVPFAIASPPARVLSFAAGNQHCVALLPAPPRIRPRDAQDSHDDALQPSAKRARQEPAL